MKTIGKHLLCEMSGSNSVAIANLDAVKHALYAAAEAANATALNGYFHQFSPTGVSGILCLAESHISIHTWPETGYAAVDIFTCGETTVPHNALATLSAAFESRAVHTREITRGLESDTGTFHNKDTSASMPQCPISTAVEPAPIDSVRQTPWYIEDADPHERHLYSVSKWLVNCKTKYQQVGIVQNASYGRILFLDGAVQSSQRDEYLYHEALVHPAMIHHAKPSRVLILGGGEGASLREVLKHKTVSHATMVDIDGELVNLCREHLPEWSAGAFNDPRARLIIDDGKKWIEKCDEKFDVIFMDLTDQIDLGPSFSLYTQDFYQSLQERLNPGGILLIQAGELSTCEFFSHCTIRKTLSTVFPSIQTYLQHVPTFFAQWSFIVAGTEKQAELSRELIDSRISKRLAQRLRFYDGQSHARMFTLPKDLVEVLDTSGTILTCQDSFSTAYEKSQTVYAI